ncbi:hypothetical protein LTR17_026309 [Elasticomyces elasticus]|nr:hypothetical protein LTR17_026309 [Elasticomyces elasticus]
MRINAAIAQRELRLPPRAATITRPSTFANVHPTKEQDEVSDYQDSTEEESNKALNKEKEEAVAQLERETEQSPLLKPGGDLGVLGSSMKDGLRIRETAIKMRTSIKEQQAEVVDMPEPQKTMMGEALNRFENLLVEALDDGSPEKLMAGDAELCAEMRRLLGPIEHLLVTCKEIKCDRDLLLVQDWLVAAAADDDTPDDPAGDEA